MALVEGITAGAFFGTAAIFIRLLKGIDAFSIAFWRLIIAAVALAIILLFLRRAVSLKNVQQNLKDLAILGVFLGLHFIFFVSSVQDTTILNATVLVNTTPIFSMFVSTFLFNVKPSRLAVLGLTISFVGICIIALADTFAKAQPSGFSLSLKGDLEAALAAVIEAFYLNFGRKTRGQMPVLSTMLPIYLFSALIVGVISVPVGAALAIPNDVDAILFIIGLGVLPTAISHTLYFSSLSNLKSFETATMALLEPIGATLLGVMIFQEIPGVLFVFGAILILLGITFVIKQQEEKDAFSSRMIES
jgi:drug/metabolite transporter (DMT)-like permease